MPILAVSGLEKYYGAERILAGVDLEIEPKQKLALVGRNGCGKTTLLKLIAGQLEADGGHLYLERGLRVGFLAQEFTAGDEANTLWAEIETVFAELSAVEQEMERVSTAMAAGGAELPALMSRYARLQEEFERRDGYAVRARLEKVLRGLGFTENDWQKPVRVMSGGERTRAALARMLLGEPELLLMDEPTNHLDLWAVAWLEEYLADYQGSLLVVSHDRYFLDRVVGGVLELDAGKIRAYQGNYTAYREARDEARRVYEHTAAHLERERARKERLVRESTADERSKRQARSIAKSIARMERPDGPAAEKEAMRLKLKSAQPTGRMALTVTDLSKSFGPKSILRQAGFAVEAGERVGIIGPNGTGKTTLLRILLGLEPPDAGEVRLGHNVQPGFLAQEEAWDGAGTVFAAMQGAGGGDNLATRNHLARYLFRGEEVFKNVSDLSGGERRRLSLARLTLSEVNLLILDEPTNHLDLNSIEALEDGLADFPGTILVVSHDRYFLGRLTDRLLALIDGRLVPFPGYEAFAAWHEQMEARAAEARAREAAARREQHRAAREIRQSPLKEEKRRAKLVAALEAELAVKEEEKASVLAKMAQPEISADFVALRELSQRLAALEGEIARLYGEWEAAADES